MRTILLITSVAILIIANTAPALAQDSSLSESAQERLKQIESKRATDSPNSTSSADKKTDFISFVEGVISSVNGGTIILNNNSGDKIIYTVDTTKYINIDSSGKKLIGLGDLKINDTILVLGLANQTTTGTAKFIVRDTTKQTRNFSLIGKISEIKDSSLVLRNFKREDLPKINLNLASGVSIIAPKKLQLKITDLAVNDTVVASGIIDDKGNLSTQQIFLNKILGPRTSTPSAQQ